MARILLVEDDPDVMPVFREFLEEAGYQVDAAEKFQTAADLLALCDYDLLLSDGVLPDGTGIMLADKAQARGIAALIVTGYPLGMLRQGEKINFDNYKILRKPIARSALLAAVSYEIGLSIPTASLEKSTRRRTQSRSAR